MNLRVDVSVFRNRYLPCFRVIQALEEQHPRLLIFVTDSGSSSPFEALWYLNVAQPEDRIVIARDLGSLDHLLMRHFPHHDPFVATEVQPGKLVVTPYRQ